MEWKHIWKENTWEHKARQGLVTIQNQFFQYYINTLDQWEAPHKNHRQQLMWLMHVFMVRKSFSLQYCALCCVLWAHYCYAAGSSLSPQTQPTNYWHIQPQVSLEYFEINETAKRRIVLHSKNPHLKPVKNWPHMVWVIVTQQLAQLL